ncbi:hypothetical protein G6F32_015645 [Rhizopus arrhizus]|nr:hypothetical protein G6F32_015645 [Rhizopus arrhizus]
MIGANTVPTCGGRTQRRRAVRRRASGICTCWTTAATARASPQAAVPNVGRHSARAGSARPVHWTGTTNWWCRAVNWGPPRVTSTSAHGRWPPIRVGAGRTCRCSHGWA